MTSEQREAIEDVEEFNNKFDCGKYRKSIDTVLSLLEQKDKQIDLMVEIFYKRFKAELLLEYGFENEEQLKQYFADLVEKE